MKHRMGREDCVYPIHILFKWNAKNGNEIQAKRPKAQRDRYTRNRQRKKIIAKTGQNGILQQQNNRFIDD